MARASTRLRFLRCTRGVMARPADEPSGTLSSSMSTSPTSALWATPLPVRASWTIGLAGSSLATERQPASVPTLVGA